MARLRPGSHLAEPTPPTQVREAISPDCRRPQPLAQRQGGVSSDGRPGIQWHW